MNRPDQLQIHDRLILSLPGELYLLTGELIGISQAIVPAGGDLYTEVGPKRYHVSMLHDRSERTVELGHIRCVDTKEPPPDDEETAGAPSS